jgi:acyl-CoA reductase-like NAD-dependent aldehyde dehydrogenase
MGDLLEERQQEMAEILTRENGKPLPEAKVWQGLYGRVG